MPSNLIGNSGDRWRFGHGTAVMLQCLRLGVRPSLLWIAGFFFPSVGLSFHVLYYMLDQLRSLAGVQLFETLVRRPNRWLPWSLSAIFDVLSSPFTGGVEGSPLIGALSVMAVLLPLACRLSAGLARVADERDWKEAAGGRGGPRFGASWSAGRGMVLETLGLWLCLQGLLLGCFGLVMGPLLLLVHQLHGEVIGNWLLIPLAGPLLLILLYASTLGVLNQLALTSLVFNRRGAASALAHAWRLVRSDPWAVTRAMLIDLVLQLSLSGANPGGGNMSALFAVVLAITGVARACYWARVYTALGGLRAVDGVPGLPNQGAMSGGAGAPGTVSAGSAGVVLP